MLEGLDIANEASADGNMAELETFLKTLSGVDGSISTIDNVSGYFGSLQDKTAEETTTDSNSHFSKEVQNMFNDVQQNTSATIGTSATQQQQSTVENVTEAVGTTNSGPMLGSGLLVAVGTILLTGLILAHN